MRSERVIIRKLRALRQRDDVLVGLDGQTFSAMCLRGLNGSGKTTYLDALAELWQWFSRCTKERKHVRPHKGSLLLEAEVVAALFTGLPGSRPRMWLAWGEADAIASLPQTDDNPYTSAGERSMLINLCMMPRWLGPGGIVLIDEPELHLHISLMRSNLAVTETLLSSKEWRAELVDDVGRPPPLDVLVAQLLP